MRSLSVRVLKVAGSAVLPCEHFDRYRAALCIAQQAEDDLCLAAFSVTRVAVARQWAATALEPGRGDVVEHQGRPSAR